MNLDKKLDFWLKHNLNVLLEGERGTGKSAQILDCFKRNNVKYLYFSAPTMDPFLHLLGIPKEVKDESGNSYLEFLKPKELQYDEVEAIYFDECNRASPRVLNSILEIIQFKSVNGKKFKNLRVIWAAINPKDDAGSYQVEIMDPAHIDRFHVYHRLPYLPDANYFRTKFGQETADTAILWWKELDNDTKKEISPRRLDYTLEMYRLGGDLRDVLPGRANINKLADELANGSITKKLDRVYLEGNLDAASKFLTVENNYSACINLIINSKNYLNFFLPVLSEERIAVLLSKNIKIENYVWGNYKKFKSLIQNTLIAQSNKALCRRLRTKCQRTIGHAWSLEESVSTIINNKPVIFGSPLFTEDFFLVAAYCKLGARTTIGERLDFINILSKTIPKKLTIEEADWASKILFNIIAQTQKPALIKMDKLIPMINHIMFFYKEKNLTPALLNKVEAWLKSQSTYIYA